MKELPSKQPPKTAKFVSSKEHGWTFMTDPCLSTRDGFIKLSHMKVICGRSRHTRRNRLNAAPMKFVQSWRNLSFRVLMKFVHIQNKISLPCKHKYFVHSPAPCKFVHSHTRIPCHHEHEPLDHSCHVKWFTDVLHGRKNFPSSVKFCGISAESRTARLRSGMAFSAIPAIFRSPRCKLRLCRPHCGLKFCMDFARTFEL